MDESNRTFIRGNRNPERYGFSIRVSCGSQPDPGRIERAAVLLGREPFYVDQHGFECELLDAAIDAATNRIAYVESRAKENLRKGSSTVDISIKIHLRDVDGNDKSTDIKSYNPFFGCDVGFFEWVDDTAILIYTEKHDTYVCAFGSKWPPRFVEIEERWIINDRMLGYIGYKQDTVQRLSIPDLVPQESLTTTDAEQQGLLPVDPYAT